MSGTGSTDQTFVDEVIDSHCRVKESGRHNYIGCRIRVYSYLNTDAFREELGEDYEDIQVVDLMEFGFPTGHDGSDVTHIKSEAHKGALEFPDAIDGYLVIEDGYRAVLGPFDENPFPNSEIALSPLNSTPKSEPGARRVILDMSFPVGHGVNQGIDKDVYLGESVKLTLPTVDDFAREVAQQGVGSLMFKRDLKRAFRQIPVDPGDINLLGYRWKGRLYFDRVLAMGLRTACYCCQRVTNAVTHIMRRKGHCVLGYIDDYFGVARNQSAYDGFDQLGALLERLGLEESCSKACAPDTEMVCLGVMFNTVTMTMEVTPERVEDTLDEVNKWLGKSQAKKKEVQILLGKLHFVCKCVRQGRVFVSRILNFLRTMEEGVVYLIPQEMRGDLKWFSRYLPTFNGVSLIPPLHWSEPDAVLASDACLTGAGAVCGEWYFHAQFPDSILRLSLHISALELLTLVVAIKVFALHLKGTRIRAFCDNMATVEVINSGKVRDPFMQACLREFCYITACNQFEVRVVHVEGVSNRIPDLLSRWHLYNEPELMFDRETAGRDMTEIIVGEQEFSFSHDW